MRTAYTYQLKSVECDQCGAPVITEPSKLDVACGFCHAQLHLVARPKDRREVSTIDEQARLASLRSQLQNEDPNGPLRVVPPDGLRSFADMLTQPAARPAAIEAIRQEWDHARGEAMAERSRQAGTRLFRIALLLERFYVAQGEDKRARAVLETALGIVPEPGQRDILRCRLAREALDAGDVDAYHAWIADCSQRPLHLEVDSELRLTRARYCNHAQKYDLALDQLDKNAPTASDRIDLGRCLRAHALVGSGDEASARNEIRNLLSGAKNPVETATVEFSDNPGPATELAQRVAREIVEGRNKKPAIIGGTDSPTPKRAKKGAGFAGCLGCLGPMVPAGIFILPMIFPTLWFSSCGMDSIHDEAMAAITDCPAALEAIGANPSGTAGVNCGNCEIEGSSGQMSFDYAVTGDRGRGGLEVFATMNGDTWTLRRAMLSADGQDIDLLACSGRSPFSDQGFPNHFPGQPPPSTNNNNGNGAVMVGVLLGQCQSGNAGSCRSLATMYEHGAGVPTDREAARGYYQMACDLGSQADCNSARNL